MSTRIYFLIYSRRVNRNRFSQLIIRHRTTWHILRSSTLSLCSFNRSCIRYYSRLCSLIPTIYRLHPKQCMNKNPFRGYIYRSKSHILPTTFPRFSRNTTTVLWLPRRLCTLKYSIFYWVTNFFSSSNHVLIYLMRSLYRQTRSSVSWIDRNKCRMITRLPSPLPHIWGASIRSNSIKLTRKEGIEPPCASFKPAA